MTQADQIFIWLIKDNFASWCERLLVPCWCHPPHVFYIIISQAQIQNKKLKTKSKKEKKQKIQFNCT